MIIINIYRKQKTPTGSNFHVSISLFSLIHRPIHDMINILNIITKYSREQVSLRILCATGKDIVKLKTLACKSCSKFIVLNKQKVYVKQTLSDERERELISRQQNHGNTIREWNCIRFCTKVKMLGKVVQPLSHVPASLQLITCFVFSICGFVFCTLKLSNISSNL